MKKLLSLTVLVLCAAVAMAQLVHVSDAQAAGCESAQTESHASHQSSVKSDSHDTQSSKKFCCESCHVQLVTMPILAIKAESSVQERIASLIVLVKHFSPDTLAEPPQA